MSRPKDLVEEAVKCLTEWLSNAKSVQEAIPEIQQQLDIARWKAETLSDAPQDFLDPFSGEMTGVLEEELKAVKRNLPDIAPIDRAALHISTINTSSSGSALYAITYQAQQFEDPQIRDWGSRHSPRYEVLQTTLGREGDVRDLLVKLKSSLGMEFDQAVDAYRAALAGAGNLPPPGIAMRNVLEHYKGELIDLALAKVHPKKQKLTWSEMAEQLVDDTGVFRKRFIQEGSRWDTLHDQLSRVAKGHVYLSEAQLRGVFADLLDHLYIVLSVVDLGSDRKPRE